MLAIFDENLAKRLDAWRQKQSDNVAHYPVDERA